MRGSGRHLTIVHRRSRRARGGGRGLGALVGFPAAAGIRRKRLAGRRSARPRLRPPAGSFVSCGGRRGRLSGEACAAAVRYTTVLSPHRKKTSKGTPARPSPRAGRVRRAAMTGIVYCGGGGLGNGSVWSVQFSSHLDRCLGCGCRAGLAAVGPGDRRSARAFAGLAARLRPGAIFVGSAPRLERGAALLDVPRRPEARPRQGT
jgi:hypothetical protein